MCILVKRAGNENFHTEKGFIRRSANANYENLASYGVKDVSIKLVFAK
jgi:hypothetical protein